MSTYVHESMTYHIQAESERQLKLPEADLGSIKIIGGHYVETVATTRGSPGGRGRPEGEGGTKGGGGRQL